MKVYILKIMLLIIVCLQLACEKFIKIDDPIDSLAQKTIFQNDDLATSAITGIYARMSSNQGLRSINTLCGLSSDEFKNYNSLITEFYENRLTPISPNLSQLYSQPYAYIYSANTVLEGLSTSQAISPTTKAQLRGEALFIRAFNYFYLVNMFGPVPLQLTTDYRVTRIEPRSSIKKIIEQIIIDLKHAEELLNQKYVTNERVRPNISSVHALLARTYLYIQDWENAEKYANLIIAQTNIYSLVDLDKVFLKNSQEAIWQLFPPTGMNTGEGSLFILTTTPSQISLNNSFVLNAFEADDKRNTTWIKSFTNTTGTYYYPFKYKIKTTTNGIINEYSMVLRLAEQYLIRAEARAQRNNLAGAIDDLDKIRNRANLFLLKDINPSINKEDLLTAILKERRVELFSEWGHRWFDLKRTTTANKTLSLIKPQWQPTDILYPIPYDEISRNPNILPQNDGY